MPEAPLGFAYDTAFGEAELDHAYDDDAVDYAPQRSPALGISTFADRAYLRAELVEDAVATGLGCASRGRANSPRCSKPMRVR